MALAAVGVFAHTVHLGLVLLGLGGVVGLLAPGWRESRRLRHTPSSPARPDRSAGRP